jgi:hypothetical protein
MLEGVCELQSIFGFYYKIDMFIINVIKGKIVRQIN